MRVGRFVSLTVLLVSLVFGAAGPATAETASDPAYEDVANWLFEKYLQQAISTMTFNVKNASAEAGRAVEAQAPSMQRFLSRHRSAFVTALLPILKEQVETNQTANLAKSLRSTTVLGDDAKQKLATVDTTFRQDEQRVLRAMTFDLRVLVEDILKTIQKSPQ
jgi:hypothetical protein